MRFVIFGLTLSSSWANGHATPWRGLLRSLHDAGHQATFFERDVDYYAAHRDLPRPSFCDLVLYPDWDAVRAAARRALADADVAIVTSYCPDGLRANSLMLDSPRPVHVFYDMDTPVTLAALERDGVAVRSGAQYLTSDLIPAFDVYLSFTGGPILDVVRTRWGARRSAPLYGSVDPTVHAPVDNPPDDLRCALGYLGTYAADRQEALESLLMGPAEARPQDRFLVVGSLYPPEIRWPSNVSTRWHLDPRDHPSFYAGNRATLSITRKAMLEWGYTPSGRLFEAAACGTPVVSDPFPGVETFFTPGSEILIVETPDDIHAALDLSDAELRAIGAAARERTLSEHTGKARADELLRVCEAVPC
ncbi:MAG: glycosyltransferase [Chloroflexota bacterium]